MSQSIEFTKRQLSRAKTTAQNALNATQPNQLALKAYAPDMLTQCDKFAAADDAVRAAQKTTSKEVTESDAALDALRALFDQTRQLVAAKVNVNYEAASSFPTPDDLLNAAEDLENDLTQADQTWAAPLLAEFTARLDAANREQQEAGDARKAEQKLVLARDQAEGLARPVLVRFRRLVRATFGSSSREYRELLDRTGRGGDDEDPSGGAGGAG